MARLPARVDWITHQRTGLKVALRLDKKTMLFQAEYCGQTFRSKNGAEVRTQVLKAIEKSHQLTFKPVIKVEVPHRNYASTIFRGADFGEGVALSVTRYYISQDDALHKLSWDDHERKNVKGVRRWRPMGFKGKPEDFTLPFSQPSQYSYGSSSHYLPYTEETWKGLQRIVKLIETAKEHLTAFLGDPSLVAKLISIGTGSSYPLLGDGDVGEAIATR